MKFEITVKQELNQLFDAFINSDTSIELVNLSTSDGFVITSRCSGNVETEVDKIAAIASSLCSLSNSAANGIIKESFLVTTIETNGGNILFLRCSYLEYTCVLSVALKANISLAQSRFLSRRLIENIQNIS